MHIDRSSSHLNKPSTYQPPEHARDIVNTNKMPGERPWFPSRRIEASNLRSAASTSTTTSPDERQYERRVKASCPSTTETADIDKAVEYHEKADKQRGGR